MPRDRGRGDVRRRQDFQSADTAKKNEQLHEPAAYKQSAELLKQALTRSPEFIDFAFPVAMAAPMMARYKPGMEYGAHADSAFIPLPARRSAAIFPALYSSMIRLTMTAASFTCGAGTPI